MRRAEFERLVEDAWREIPRRFRQRVENVAILVEDEPGRRALRQAGVPPGDTLLGFYQGVPLTERGSWYQMVLPDRILLYQGPIEREARDEADIPRVVYETLWHELAHYFGMSEPEVRASERKRRKRERNNGKNMDRSPVAGSRSG